MLACILYVFTYTCIVVEVNSIRVSVFLLALPIKVFLLALPIKVSHYVACQKALCFFKCADNGFVYVVSEYDIIGNVANQNNCIYIITITIN